MERKIPESDWKYISKLKEKFLNRLCERINAESLAILKNGNMTQHEKYLELYKHIEKGDFLIAKGFNDWRRSRAFENLLFYKQQGLITDEEFEGLSNETKQVLAFFLG